MQNSHPTPGPVGVTLFTISSLLSLSGIIHYIPNLFSQVHSLVGDLHEETKLEARKWTGSQPCTPKVTAVLCLHEWLCITAYLVPRKLLTGGENVWTLKNFHYNIRRFSYRLSQEVNTVKYRVCQSQSGGTEQSHRNPRDHRSNFSKAHRTRFKTGRIRGKLLAPLHSSMWKFILSSGQPFLTVQKLGP